jgi:hypothetical protein
VTTSNTGVLSVTLNRQFQLKMAPTLAYVLGLVIAPPTLPPIPLPLPLL